MKTYYNRLTYTTAILGIATLALVSTQVLMAQPMAPPSVVQPAPLASTPVPMTAMPAPGVPVNTGVPDSYVWDGKEFVGVIADQYFYLGAGNVWLPMDSDHMTRFNDWIKEHRDWRERMTRNERYRLDSKGKWHPLHEHDADQRSHI